MIDLESTLRPRLSLNNSFNPTSTSITSGNHISADLNETARLNVDHLIYEEEIVETHADRTDYSAQLILQQPLPTQSSADNDFTQYATGGD